MFWLCWLRRFPRPWFSLHVSRFCSSSLFGQCLPSGVFCLPRHGCGWLSSCGSGKLLKKVPREACTSGEIPLKCTLHICRKYHACRGLGIFMRLMLDILLNSGNAGMCVVISSGRKNKLVVNICCCFCDVDFCKTACRLTFHFLAEPSNLLRLPACLCFFQETTKHLKTSGRLTAARKIRGLLYEYS